MITVIALFTYTPTDQASLLRHANMIERGSHEGIPKDLDRTDQASLLRHANMIERGSHEGIPKDLDRKDIKERYLSAVKAIGQA